MLYAVHAVVNRKMGEGTVTIQVPTFYLDSNTQGIVDVGHASRIAHSMLESINPAARVHAVALAHSADTDSIGRGTR